MKRKLNIKLFAFFLCIIATLAMTACEKGGNPSGETETPSADATPTEDVTPTPSVEPSPTDEVWKGAEDDKLVAKGTGMDNAIVVFHYQRKNGDYTDWQMWLWTPSTDGAATDIANKDDFGVYFKIDLADSEKTYYHATTINYIYRLPDWEAKDEYSDDRSVELDSSMLNEKNEIHLYSFEGVESIYTDMNKEHVVRFVKSAILDSTGTKVNVSSNDKAIGYELYKNDVKIDSKSVANKLTFEVVLPEAYTVGDNYKVNVLFEGNQSISIAVNVNTYFDSDDFNNNYTYTGDDLGVTLTENTTTFKVWAPISSKVTVEIFNYGHPSKLGTTKYPGDDSPSASYELVRGEKGVWSCTVNDDLTGKYYTYSVTNSGKEIKDIVDPYAKAAGLNGLRGYIVNFENLNPEGWDTNYKRPYSPSELIVYEMHVRDLTMDKTWTGTEANRGKYLGLSEEGTTYTDGTTTVKTGFDHIKELGVNAVQILPFFDQANDELSNTFNWGYNPQNYNVLEGQYSSNPYDAEVRIKEFKAMVQAYQKAGIEIIMDVVYNHMNGISGSSFDKIVPGYYFRYNEKGAPSNGSGCGNETASERPMFRKYMIDSTEFWAKEYNLAGFRFDLMGLHDTETMNLIAENLKAIDENIVIYGEPWTGGTSTLASDRQATTANAKKLTNVGMFNDSIRDAIKGSVFNTNVGGFIQGVNSGSTVSASMNGLKVGAPTQQLNYVACHDNNTLADKLIQSYVSEEDLSKASIASNALVFLSEGISFMLNGDEILRSKVIIDENGNYILDENGKIEYSHNSYNLPDCVNSIKWNEKITNIETFNAYKELIAINRAHKVFQMSSKAQINSRYNIKKADGKAIVVEISSVPQSMQADETWKKATIIVTNKKCVNEEVYTLTGDWKVAFASGNTTAKVDDVLTGSISCGTYSVLVLYQAK